MKVIKVYLCCMLAILLLVGCKNKKILKLKQDVFEVELGTKIIKEPTCYLDLEGLSDKEIESIKTDAEVIIKETSQKEDIRLEKTYENIGEYQVQIKYHNETLDFLIHIDVHQDPIILGPQVITIKKDEVINCSDYYQVHSFTKYPTPQFDTSKINRHKIGEYPMTISVGDIQRTVKVKVQETISKVPKRIVLDVPYYNQLDVHAPNGCEATALYMALKYKNVIEIDLKSFIETQPTSTSPYLGFSGNPFKKATKKGDYYTIFPSALIQHASYYKGIRDISHSTLQHIIDELVNGSPVIVWVTSGFHKPKMQDYYFGQAPSHLHIVLLNGYDIEKEIFYVKDPINKDLTEVSFQDFQTSYQALEFAISVEG